MFGKKSSLLCPAFKNSKNNPKVLLVFIFRALFCISVGLASKCGNLSAPLNAVKNKFYHSFLPKHPSIFIGRQNCTVMTDFCTTALRSTRHSRVTPLYIVNLELVGCCFSCDYFLAFTAKACCEVGGFAWVLRKIDSELRVDRFHRSSWSILMFR